MQPFAFVVQAETMSQAQHQAVDQHVAALFASSASKLGSIGRSLRAYRRPTRRTVLTSQRSVGAER